jgi:hypothetical protein
MGIAQTHSCNNCFLKDIESFSLTPNNFPKKVTLSNGFSVVKLEDNVKAIIFTKEITSSSEKAAL